MSRLLLIQVLVGIALTSHAIPGSANPLSAKRNGTKVTELPENGSNVIVSLSEGDIVQSIARKGMFWQVKTEDGREGYVAVTTVQRHTGDKSTIANAMRRAVTEGREEGDDVSRKRMRTAVMGVRGLDEDEDTASAGNVRPNMPLVYKMEDRWVEAQRVESLDERLQAEIVQRMNMRYGH